MNKLLGAVAGTGLLGSIVAANYMTTRYGFLPVGFGLTAAAGTFAAGFALALRDATQDALGKRWVLAVLAAGALLSYAVADPFIATASAAAFAISELADFAIYTRLRRHSHVGDRRWAGAVVASNLAGAVLDTVAFLAIAFGWAAVLPALAGQLVGKAWATGVYLILGKVVARGAVRGEPVHAGSA